MKIAEMCRLPLFGMAALLILSGCSLEKIGSPLLFPSDSPYSSETAKAELTSAERAVFERTGTIDRNLEPSMEYMVRHHFIKYSREKRVTMQHFLRNAKPYIGYTMSVFREKGLPQDLAYLAYLESGYNPLAVSRSKATGLWQFISSTGKIYGLSQDWWMDERMDPYRSTQAAADYLSRLYEVFGDWHLAIASYNGGEGAVGRAKKAAGAQGLDDILKKNEALAPSVQLREETRLYVPRFLAIAKIMRDPETLGLKALPADPDHPELLPVVELKARPATDLVELARRLGMPWKEFLFYNPHFLRSISPVNRTASVYVPQNKADKARKLLEGRLSGSGWRYYKVKSGDTLASVSKKTGVPASIIRQLNPAKLKKGQRLRLPAIKGSVPPFEPMIPTYEPAASSPAVSAQQNVTAALAELEGRVAAPAAVPFEYVVQPGDTLSGIAKKYGTTVREIEKANGGAGKVASLRAGQIIRLTADEPAAYAEPAEREVKREPVVQRTHKVKNGDTLSGIAKKYGTTVRGIQQANGGADKLKTLRVGQIIKLPSTKEQLRILEEQRKEDARRAEELRKAEEARIKAELAKAVSHTVQGGDTLSSIAKKYGTTVRELQKVNGGADKLKTLRIGQKLALPARGQSVNAVKAGARPAPAAAKPEAKSAVKPVAMPERENAGFHTVQNGDTLSAIARKHGTTVRELQLANGGADKLKTLRIGQKIHLPGVRVEQADDSAAAALMEIQAARKSDGVAPVSAPAKEVKQADQGDAYKVQSGDSIWGITHRFGMSEAEFKALNKNVDSSSLRVGSTVRVIRRK